MTIMIDSLDNTMKSLLTIVLVVIVLRYAVSRYYENMPVRRDNYERLLNIVLIVLVAVIALRLVDSYRTSSQSADCGCGMRLY